MSQVLAFTGVGAVMAVAPGPNTALVLQSSVRQGIKQARATAMGITAGVACHAVAAVVGLSALLAASSFSMDVIRIVGALYLAFLGFQALRSRVKDDHATDDKGCGGFVQGAVSSLLNPKVILLFLALLPEFVTPGSTHHAVQVLILSGIFVGMSLVWMLALAQLATVLKPYITRPKVALAVQRVLGVTLIAIAVEILVG